MEAEHCDTSIPEQILPYTRTPIKSRNQSSRLNDIPTTPQSPPILQSPIDSNKIKKQSKNKKKEDLTAPRRRSSRLCAAETQNYSMLTALTSPSKKIHITKPSEANLNMSTRRRANASQTAPLRITQSLTARGSSILGQSRPQFFVKHSTPKTYCDNLEEEHAIDSYEDSEEHSNNDDGDDDDDNDDDDDDGNDQDNEERNNNPIKSKSKVSNIHKHNGTVVEDFEHDHDPETDTDESYDSNNNNNNNNNTMYTRSKQKKLRQNNNNNNNNNISPNSKVVHADVSYYLSHPSALSSLITNYHHLESKLEAAQDQIVGTEALLQQKQLTLVQQQEQFQTYRQQTTQQHDEILHDLREQITTMELNMTSQNIEISRLNEQVANQSEELQKSRQRIDTMKSRNKNELKQQLDELYEQNTTLQTENERLLQEIAIHKSSLSSTSSLSPTSQKTNISSTVSTISGQPPAEDENGSRSLLLDKYTKLLQENTNLLSTIEQLRNELETSNITQSPSSTTKKCKNPKTKKSSSIAVDKTTSWEDECELLEQKVLHLEHQRDEAENKLQLAKQTTKELLNDCNALEDQLETTQENYDNKVQQYDTLQQQYEELLHKSDEYLLTINKHVESLEQSQQTIDTLNAKFESVNIENTTLQQNMSLLEQQYQKSQKDYKILENSSDDLQKQFDLLQKDYKTSQQQSITYQNNLEQLSDECHQLKLDLEQCENELQTYKTQEEIYTNEISTLQQRIEELNNTLETKEFNIENLHESIEQEYILKIHNLELSINEVASAYEQLQNDSQTREGEMQKQLEVAQNDYDHCLRQGKKIAIEYKSLKKDTTERLKASESQYQNELALLTSKHNDALLLIETKYSTLQQQYDTLVKDHKKLQDAASEEQQHMENDLNSLETTIQDLQTALQAKERDCESIISKYTQLQTKYSILEQETKVSDKQRKQYLNSVNETRDAMNQLDNEINQIKKENVEYKSVIEELEEKLNLSNNEMVEANECFTHLTKRYEQLKRVLSEKIELLRKTRQDYATLESAKRHCDEELSILQHELIALRSRNGMGNISSSTNNPNNNNNNSGNTASHTGTVTSNIVRREVPSSVRKNLQRRGGLDSRMSTIDNYTEERIMHNNINNDDDDSYSLLSDKQYQQQQQQQQPARKNKNRFL